MCFGLDWLLHVIVILIVLCAIVAILRIWVFPMMAGVDSRIPATINIVIWVVVAVFVAFLCFQLLECAMGGGFGTLLPRTGPRG